ncbi:suppressor of glycerol defect [Pseudogymnoascus verrucosus]|uniref:Suppressor of glycerol defect n=1 Tax=Pseudogymnoascus verrucosus TaxID=342668 RepID=A0A1B8GBV1_9PEZI|nr:suppressor of glycerol defect [Pseudogymnoascus verrucosus]OBT93311.1 suppressor of glycerol defect [Pseudogymnoascus verrucosus]
MPPRDQLKLPAKIIEELGGKDVLGYRKQQRPLDRKDRRKAERVQKKVSRSGQPPFKKPKVNDPRGREPVRSSTSTEASNSTKESRDTKEPQAAPEPKLKSILKTASQASNKPSKRIPAAERLRSPTPPPKRPSRAVLDKLAEDDEEIALLEKKLGIKGKKALPQAFRDDGLDELLGGIDELVGGEDEELVEKRKRKSEGDEWLDMKRKKARKMKAQDVPEVSDEDMGDSDAESVDSDQSDEFGLQSDEGSDLGMDDDDMDSDIGGNNDEDSEFSEFDEPEEPKRVRENPYLPPTAPGAVASAKYMPPSLRKQSASESEDLARLRRQIQGLVNKLTEANLISILGEVETIYRNNARQHVSSTLVDILLVSVCEPAALSNTHIILLAGFISAVYKVIGADFGTQVIQQIVERFDKFYSNIAGVGDTKETSNLITLVSELYNFQVIGSTLVFDYIRMFLGTFSELNTELLLKMIRTSGPQLRQNDPSSLKDIVIMLRPAVEKAGGEENMSVRTKFMIETINDLKNNKMKTGAAASAVISEHTIRMKKTLGTLNSRSLKSSEPLRIGLDDIRQSDSKGKWWLVGASWTGNEAANRDGVPSQPTSQAREVDVADDIAMDTRTTDLGQLAREQRMNTDVRRAIFIAIMSASDFQDAYMRLNKLKLKKSQELEIPKVLIHCSGAEASYNPFYTLIAKKLCGDRKLKMAFQFSLWDLFKKMGEGDNEDDVPDEDDEDALSTRQIVNLAKMFGALIVDGGLTISILKNLNLTYLQPKTQTFVEVLFISMFLHPQKQPAKVGDKTAIATLIGRVQDTPSMMTGLQYFIQKVVKKTDIAGGKDEKLRVKQACKVAIDTLRALAARDAV